MKNGMALALIAALGLAALYATAGNGAKKKAATKPPEQRPGEQKPAAEKPAAQKPEIVPAGPTTIVTTPEGEQIAVTLPSEEQLADIIQDALDAANQVDGAAVKPAAVKPAAVKPAAVKPAEPAVKPVVAKTPSDEKARAMAPGLAKHLRQKKYDYTRQAVRDFQAAAGIAADGIYGPVTAAKLKEYEPNAPPALFRPKKGG